MVALTRPKEPKPRKDGRCARKGCENIVVIALVKGVPEHERVDAFCSSKCAKEYFGVDFSSRSYVPLKGG